MKPGAAHIRGTAKIIESYARPDVTKAVGDHLEGLVKYELWVNGFNVVARNSATYDGKTWAATGHNLDFVAEHSTSSLRIGVEVKNTWEVIDRQELLTKIQISQHLGLTPVFATRWIKPLFDPVLGAGGFAWFFKSQIYPPGFDQLVHHIKTRLGLPAEVLTEVPERQAHAFTEWVRASVRSGRALLGNP